MYGALELSSVLGVTEYHKNNEIVVRTSSFWKQNRGKKDKHTSQTQKTSEHKPNLPNPKSKGD